MPRPSFGRQSRENKNDVIPDRNRQIFGLVSPGVRVASVNALKLLHCVFSEHILLSAQYIRITSESADVRGGKCRKRAVRAL